MMKAKIIYCVPIVLACLAGCATPPGDFTFKLDANDSKTSKRSFKSLGNSGRLIFKFRLEQTVSQAASFKIQSNGTNSDNPVLLVRFDDSDCKGAYTVSAQHKTGLRESRIEYFAQQIPWGTDNLLVLEWKRSGFARLQLNNGTPLDINLDSHIGDIQLEAKRGIIEIDNLNYQIVQPNN